MGAQLNRLAANVVGLVLLMGLLPVQATAQSHPQEVLDLIAAHAALAMKIRPLHDRVVVAPSPKGNGDGFKPEGVPLRAKTNVASGENETAAESRVSETLRHKDRAATSSDDYGRIKVRLSTLEENVRAERARISRPGFGMRSSRVDRESGSITFGDGIHGSRPPSGTTSQDKPAAAGDVDAKAIADARKALAALQREFAALEREANALSRR